MDERHVVRCLRVPADAQRAEVVVPAVRALDHPATRAPAPARAWPLAASSKMWLDAAHANRGFGIVVVVAFVEAEILRSTRAARRRDDHSIERRGDHPLVVDVRAGQRHGDRDSATVGEDVAFRAEFATIGRIWPRKIPPLGALTEALSSEAQAQSMPRCSS